MPKLKSNRGASKRFKSTASGRVKCAHSHHNHILTKKDPKRKRHLRGGTYVADADTEMVKRLLPYI